MKKKPVPKEDESDASDAVDEPEEVSDDDGASRRRSSRTTRNAGAKKAKLAEPSSSEGEEEGEEEEEEGEDEEEEGEDEEDSADSEEEYKTDQVKKRRKNDARGRPPSKKNGAVTSPVSSDYPSFDEHVPNEFSSGSYVVLKTDLANGGDPPIWKIDGKALLQKYIPFEQDGKTLYKNTSTYSGWSTGNKDNYHSAPIAYKVQNRKETIVEFLRDAVKVDGSIPATPAATPAEEKKEAAATEQ